MKTVRTRISFFVIPFLVFLGLSGCNNNPVTSSAANENVQMNFAVSDETDNPSGNIIITEAKALISKIEIHGPDGNKQIRLEPVVFRFDLNGNVANVIAGLIPDGIYTKIQFQIHKPRGNEEVSDAEFLSANGHSGFSIIIKGTRNGNLFVYKSKKTINVSLNFDTPINVNTDKRNITVLLQEKLWFRFSGGGECDPWNPDHENAIDENIRRSFVRAFQDDDLNGRPDGN
jgi:hypothetical protein